MGFLVQAKEHRVGANTHDMEPSVSLPNAPVSNLPTGPLRQYPTEEQGLFNCVFADGPCGEINQSILESLTDSPLPTGMAVQAGTYSVEPLVMSLMRLARSKFTNWGSTTADPSVLLKGLVDIKQVDPGLLRTINASINAREAVGQMLHNINTIPRKPGKIWIPDPESGKIIGYKVYTKYNPRNIGEAVRHPDDNREIGYFRFSYEEYINDGKRRLVEIERQLRSGIAQ